MPVVLRHRASGEIACAVLKNIYDFAYFGALWWDDNETAEEQAASALDLAGYVEDGGWDALEVKEERLKLFNVKLNNDRSRRLFLHADGTIAIIKS